MTSEFQVAFAACCAVSKADVPAVEAIKRLIARLRSRCPTNFPVRFKWVDQIDGDTWGDCEFINKRGKKPYFQVRMSVMVMEVYDWACTWDLVVHEYAHALAWTPAHRNLNDHGPLWGVAYSACYMAAEKLL